MTRIYIDLINGRNQMSIKEKHGLDPSVIDDVVSIEIAFEKSCSRNPSDLAADKDTLFKRFATSSYLSYFPWIISINSSWVFDLFAIRLLDPKLLKLEWLKGTFIAEPELRLQQCEQDPEVRTACYICGVGFMIRKQKLKHYASCFISYSHLDEPFVKYLYSRLSLNTSCWFAPEDMKVGAKIREAIDTNIKNTDRLLLVLSANSINSNGLRKKLKRHSKKNLGLKKQFCCQ